MTESNCDYQVFVVWWLLVW